MARTRIYELPQSDTLLPGDVVAVDNPEAGTRAIPASMMGGRGSAVLSDDCILASSAEEFIAALEETWARNNLFIKVFGTIETPDMSLTVGAGSSSGIVLDLRGAEVTAISLDVEANDCTITGGRISGNINISGGGTVTVRDCRIFGDVYVSGGPLVIITNNFVNGSIILDEALGKTVVAGNMANTITEPGGEGEIFGNILW